MTTNVVAIPDAVLNELLSFLYMDDMLALERVNCSWRRAMASASLWTHAWLEHQWHSSTDATTLVKLLAMRHGPQVKKLTLIGCVVAEGALVKAAKFFPNLTHLTVSGCQTLADADFTAVCEAASQQLLEVRAVKCLRLTDSALQTIGDQLSQSLEKMNFSYCRQISSDGLKATVRRCKKLRSIKLKGSPAVTSAVVTCIAKSCPNLKTLLVGGAKNLTDDCLFALGVHCPKLMTLDISRSNPFGFGRGGITDDGLRFLALHCTLLKDLNLGGQGRLTLSVLSSLANSCPTLETLDIGGCRVIISNPIRLGAELKCMRRLHELGVTFTSGLKEGQIDFIASQCPQLKLVEMSLPPPAICKS
ncbi:putative F-box domain, leucine-rich repeat domain superfamily, F-box-like domain superfamily [Plasmopara halstedii]